MSDSQSAHLSSLNFKKKGWTKAKLMGIAQEHHIDIGSAATFHQVRAVLVAAQRETSDMAFSPSSHSESSSIPDSTMAVDGTHQEKYHETVHQYHDGDDDVSRQSTSSGVTGRGDITVQHTNSLHMSPTNPSLLPSLDTLNCPDDIPPSPLKTADSLSTGKGATRNMTKANISSISQKNPPTTAKESLNDMISSPPRTIKIKTSVYEECKAMCDNLGMPNSDMASLNFLCERSLPPDYHDKNDDDQNKALSAATRAIGVFSGEPYFPQDIDVMNRVLKISHSGDHILCSHTDFFDQCHSNRELETKSIGSSSTGGATTKDDTEIRVLWLRYPVFQSQYSPCRNERIEFTVGSNTSKMVLDVDRTIRSLIAVHDTHGLSKRNDKRNAFYLTNSYGDVVLLNSGLLKKCPLKRDIIQRGSKVWQEPLYLCLYRAVPGENPVPEALRNREWNYTFPLPEMFKILFLTTIYIIRNWRFFLNAEGYWFDHLIDALLSSSKITVASLGPLFDCVVAAHRFSIAPLLSEVLYALTNTFFPFLKESYAILADIVPLLILFIAGRCLMKTIRLRAKFCIINLSWLMIDRYWYILAAYQALLSRFIFKISRGWLGVGSNGFLGSHEDGDLVAVMRVRYEEGSIRRFIVFRWIKTENYDEDYELWSSTLRSVLGIATSSQNDPDMLVSDPISPGLRVALSASFLQKELYNSRKVFKISKPGTISSGARPYFSRSYFMLLSVVCWVFYDVVLPSLHEGSSPLADASIPTILFNFLWRNTLAALLVDLQDLPRSVWPSKLRLLYSCRFVIVVTVGSLLWRQE